MKANQDLRMAWPIPKVKNFSNAQKGGARSGHRRGAVQVISMKPFGAGKNGEAIHDTPLRWNSLETPLPTLSYKTWAFQGISSRALMVGRGRTTSKSVSIELWQITNGESSSHSKTCSPHALQVWSFANSARVWYWGRSMGANRRKKKVFRFWEDVVEKRNMFGCCGKRLGVEKPCPIFWGEDPTV